MVYILMLNGRVFETAPAATVLLYIAYGWGAIVGTLLMAFLC